MNSFYSHGKLLITGEYAVLDGAKALALPTKFGQSLELKEIPGEKVLWKSLDRHDQTWLQAEISFENGQFHFTEGDTPEEKALQNRLEQILSEANKMNPDILKEKQGLQVITKLEFERNWGLGSSSTLINNIASWFKIDAFELLNRTFSGSGYDIAVAQSSGPVIYQRNEQRATSLRSHFDPAFKDQLFFVHLNRKQNSREAIAHYRNQPKEDLDTLIGKISGLTEKISLCEDLQEFEMLLEIHETLISKAINLPKIKSDLFPDYPRKIKSLGGWGGDFILATGGEEEKEYFRSKGYSTILSYEEMIA